MAHGLWDSPRVFDPLCSRLAEQRHPLLIPHLPHGLGQISLQCLAEQLMVEIETAFGTDQAIDLLGFSMGGLIGRIWIQQMGGYRNTRRFISVGSPHHGSLVAQPWPRRFLTGVAEMKLGSQLLQQLNTDLTPLTEVECCSFYSPADLMVVPGWRAVLPLGRRVRLPVWTHRQLIRSPVALKPLTSELLRP